GWPPLRRQPESLVLHPRRGRRRGADRASLGPGRRLRAGVHHRQRANDLCAGGPMNAELQPATDASIALGVPAEEYHRRELGVATSGVLRMLRDRTPAHYRAWVDAQDNGDTPALVFGRAYHCRVL